MDPRRFRPLVLALSLLCALPSEAFAQDRERPGRPSQGSGGSGRPAPSPSPSPAPSRPSPSPAPSRPSPSPAPAPSRPAPSPAPSRPSPTPAPSRPSPIPSPVPTRPSPSPAPSRPTPTPTRPSPTPAPVTPPSPQPTTPSPSRPTDRDRSAPTRPSAPAPVTPPPSTRPSTPPPSRTPPSGRPDSSSTPPSRERTPSPTPAPAPSNTRPRFPTPAPRTPEPSTRPSNPTQPTPPRTSPTNPSAPVPERTGPSAGRVGRTPLAPGSARPAPERSEPPSSGSRPIERDAILERYGRTERKAAETPSATQPAAPARGDDAVKSARDAYRGEQAAKDAARRENAAEAKARSGEEAVKSARDGYRGEQAAKDAARRENAASAKARSEAEAARVRDARTQFRSEEGARSVKERRDDFRAQQLKSERDVYRAEAARKESARAAKLAEERTRVVRDAYEGNPYATPQRWSRGRTASSCHGWGLSIGFGLGLGWCNPYGWSWSSNCWPNWYWNGWSNCNNYWYWWGLGGYSYSWLCHPFSWNYRWNYGCWPNYRTWWPSLWVTSAWAPPVYYASAYDNQPEVVIYDYDDTNDIVVQGGRVEVRQGASSGASAPAAVGEAVQYEPSSGKAVDPVVAGVLGQSGPDTSMRLVQQYLANGDAAFRESRYGDAAHHYAKAIELKPEEGVLYLVLSDALLATGDYHYGAFALRRAFELEPTLVESDIDKRTFYRDPREFDDHMQLLERFLADRPTDVDARLLLAVNYLFSARPELAVDLLEAGSSAELRAESTGQRVLAAAKAAIARRKL